MDFDIIISVGPHDQEIIKAQLEYTKKNVIGYRNIYLICADPTICIEGTITINENIFPFTKENVIEIIGNVRVDNGDRTGWYLQQLLKMYAGKVIPGILKRYLIIDSDTHFLKPTEFITQDGKHLFTTSQEYTKEYFEHMNKLHPLLQKYHPLSGISHHAFFHTDRLTELMELVEKYHTNEVYIKPFWTIFLEKVLEMLQTTNTTCVCSEYEIYFNYMYHFRPEEIIIRDLKWANVPYLDTNKDDDYQAVHWYLR